MPRKPCAEPSCQKIVPLGTTRCAKHEQAKRMRDKRPSAARRGYGREWQQIRAAHLAAHPVCEESGCRRLAEEVHHIVPLRKGGTNDASNLMALCKHCHSRRTCREDGGFGNG
jgi:5-methylcytosine-specific restriction protein A